MKILILGASGQLGREWQAYLTGFDYSALHFIPYTSDQLDITDYENVTHEISEQQPDVIINCAAYTKVDEAEEEREKALQINGKAIKKLSAICAKNDILLVHFSTDYVFAGTKEDRERFPAGYPEDHPADPVNWYGETKWEGEAAIRRSGCPHLIMRVSWLCGAYGSNFVTTMLQLAENNNQLDVVDDQIGTPTFTYSLVRTTFKLIELKQKGTYHYSAAGKISWANFAEAIFEHTAKDVAVKRIPSSHFPTKAARPFFSKLDTGKIEQVEGVSIENWKVELSQLLQQINKDK